MVSGGDLRLKYKLHDVLTTKIVGRIEWERAGRTLAILAMLGADVAVALATIEADVVSQEM